MASPFKVFRRHRKVWMAILTVMAMIAFCFLSGPGITDFFSRSAAPDPPVVKTKELGSLTNQQLRELVMRRQRLKQFTRAVAQTVFDAGGDFRLANDLFNRLSSAPDAKEQDSVIDLSAHGSAGRETGLRHYR